MKNEHQAPTHFFATVGALTERGGRVTTATSGLTLAGLEVACVGDVMPHVGNAAVMGDLIHYPDGSTARVISGLGLADRSDFAPLAFVGSKLDNGDTITDSPERRGRTQAQSPIPIPGRWWK